MMMFILMRERARRCAYYKHLNVYVRGEEDFYQSSPEDGERERELLVVFVQSVEIS